MTGAARRVLRRAAALSAGAGASVGLALATSAAEAGGGAWQARVEIDVRLPAVVGRPALRVRELSALAWDAERGELVAASDRGWLLRFAPPSLSSGAVHFERAVELVPAVAGTRDANVEALTWRAGGAEGRGRSGALWLAAEHGAGPQFVDVDGRVAPGPLWPAALASALRDSRHGIEAMTWDARHGFVAGLQRPHAWTSSEPLRHALHADDGRQWHFLPSGRGSSLKAVEALGDGGWLVLERIAAPGGGYRTLLRRLDPERCAATGPAAAAMHASVPVICDASVVPVVPPLPDGPDNFEGLACAGDGRCWIVSDGGTSRSAPTRLVQWRLERQ